jgi:hypothetical protein
MKRSYLHPVPGLLAVLLAMLACVLPGQQAAPPASGIDPNTVASAVAGTAQAAVQQTAAVAPPVTSLTGTAIETAENGTTKYTDYDGNFTVTYPAGWLAVRPDSEEFNAALEKQGGVNTMLKDQMVADLAGYEANYDRLYAYILRPDIQKNVILGFSKMVWDSETNRPMDNTMMGELVRELETSGDIPGFRVDTAQIYSVGAIDMLEISGRWALNEEGELIPFYSTFVFFKPTSGTGVRITFSYLEDYRTQISADVKSIIQSITVPAQ